MAVLPDVLQQGLVIVFCGTAPSPKSARDGAYYAHGGNLFWRTLHAVGLTSTCLAPSQFRDLLRYGIGLTDLNKRQSGVDTALDTAAFDAPGLRRKIERFRPHILAFTSKQAARLFFGHLVDYGPQPEQIGETVVWVLPSTSGSARPHWGRLEHHWYQLAAFVRDQVAAGGDGDMGEGTGG